LRKVENISFHRLQKALVTLLAKKNKHALPAGQIQTLAPVEIHSIRTETNTSIVALRFGVK
jgi:hypothetical protein